MTLNLWTEIFISGFFYLLAIFFLMLRLLGVDDLSFLSRLQDYLVFVSFWMIVACYLLGILAHRLTSALLRSPARWLERRLFRSRVSLLNVPKSDHLNNFVKVLQYGSVRLNRELDFQFSTLALFRQLIIAVPVLALSSLFWLAITPGRWLIVPVLAVALLLEVSVFVAHQRQHTHYTQLRDAAFHEAENMKK
jgi:hypothetical protein